ncbi:MAG: zinc-ribbon domain-containing protein [Eubacterium sp.]|nr:zinc-ribbon domain-containing protein [Eubacterium sp.]
MKNCKNCNAELNDDVKFCTACGAEQDAVVTAETPVNETFDAAPAQPENSNVYFTPGTEPQPAAFYSGAAPAMPANVAPPKKKTGLKVVIAIVAILVVVGIAFGVKVALSGGSSIEPGVVDGNTYTNSSVDVKISSPDGWNILNGAELAEFIGSAVDESGRVPAPDGGYYECMFMSDIGENIIVMTVNGNIIDAAMSEDDFMKQTASQFSLNGKVSQSYKLTIGGNEYNCFDCASVSDGVSLNQTICVVKEGKQYFFVIFTLAPDFSEETVSGLVDTCFTAANN